MRETQRYRAWQLATASIYGLLAIAFGAVAVTGGISLHEQAAAEAKTAAIAEAAPPAFALQSVAEQWAAEHWGAPINVNATLTIPPVVCAKTYVEATWPEEHSSSRARTKFDVIFTTDERGALTILYTAPSTSAPTTTPLCTPDEPTPAWILGLLADTKNEKEDSK
ncbi:hypothetical protein [Cryobacterium sp. TMT1-66-1]|uniref:hypothetical protein n=1 Tax=Cryobacterium sp. TMT1-66-1 TaxID=1259242 RepID=UPI00141AB7E0|nr:hypothetical protein [Cryobacterium sp. TMT1-66-1]